ncbi:MAG: HlyD family efflux transporter periplasmic adaptor subunit [Phormidesmis sp. RL_2_1]|nr:HlyD family efflux transporter periplasmic adaptor subunit [Phormidesmis sp. RL_2_1]
MTNSPSHEQLAPINTYDFLPSVNRWVAVGSWFIVLAVGGAIAASFFVKYRTTVKAPAIVRPEGEARLVQSTAAGTVVNIHTSDNTPVKQGDVIAELDATGLEARAVELLANFDQGNNRLKQIDAQIIAAEQQLVAETAQSQRATAAFAAEYNRTLRANQDQSIAAQSAVQEAQVQLNLLAQETESFRHLVESGAVSRLQLYEKQAALASAQARMVSLQAALNPSQGDVQAAKERIFEAEAGGIANVARFQQSKQLLFQQRLEIQEQIKTLEQQIVQVNLDLQNTLVRAPVAGTLYDLTLRNTGQVVNSGETIARVIPADSPLMVRAMVPTEQINKVEVNLPAQIRVDACPFSEFGTVAGRVTEISPDITTLPAANNAGVSSPGSTFYTVMIATERSTLLSGRQEQCVLVPGIAGQATIISREETIINFLRRKVSLMTQTE